MNTLDHTTPVLTTGSILKGATTNYIVENMINEGRYGRTYLAIVQSTGQKVAIKQLAPENGNLYTYSDSIQDMASEPSGRFGFDTEVKFLQSIDSPHVIKVLERIDEGCPSYVNAMYVLEYIDGISLNDYIAKTGAMDERKALAVLHAVTKGVRSIHEAGMVHLDIKTSNIMIGKDGRVCLIDFDTLKPHLDSHIRIGTQGYMPVECASDYGKDLLPTPMDIYSLGATLLKMLTGQNPPLAEDIAIKGLPFDLLKNHQVSDKVIGLIGKCMAVKWKERVQTASELLNLIETIIGTATTAPLDDVETVMNQALVTEDIKNDGITIEKADPRT